MSCEIVDSMTRTLFVCAWADAEEEAGRGYPGQDLFDVAPEEPIEAHHAAWRLCGMYEQANGLGIQSIAHKASEADNANSDTWVPISYEKFGYYLAMMALGHGVSWFDDHAKFDLKEVHFEWGYELLSGDEN